MHKTRGLDPVSLPQLCFWNFAEQQIALHVKCFEWICCKDQLSKKYCRRLVVTISITESSDHAHRIGFFLYAFFVNECCLVELDYKYLEKLKIIYR